MPKIKEVIRCLEEVAPPVYQESYDNSGLLTGNSEAELKGALITLDTIEEVIDEAIALNCNLIISHHPIIFKGLKKLTGSNYVERTIIKALKHDIAIYAIHTNLDSVLQGVNHKIAEKLGLINLKILSPRKQLLKKLVTFIPVADTDKVMKEVYTSGAGHIGNYSECSFRVEGTGSFKPNETANPTIGKANEAEFVKENRVEVIFPTYLEDRIVSSLIEAHPYEEPAYDVFLLENSHKEVGAGLVGELPEPVSELDFLMNLKRKMYVFQVRHTAFLDKKVTKVAVCGGSGSFLLKDAMRAKADFFVTADFKYHEFFDAEKKIVIADIGHYESEVYTKELIYEILSKKFTNIALILSKVVSNPIRYT